MNLKKIYLYNIDFKLTYRLVLTITMFTNDIALSDISQKYINASKSTVIIVLTNIRVIADDIFRLVNIHIKTVTVSNDITKCPMHNCHMVKYCS